MKDLLTLSLSGAGATQSKTPKRVEQGRVVGGKEVWSEERGGSQGGFDVGESEERGGQKPMSKSKFLCTGGWAH